MGFDCGFSAIKKFKDYTVRDYIEVERYLNWLDNPWNHEVGHYLNYKDYWENFSEYRDEDKEFPGEPPEEIVKFYRDNKVKELFSWSGWNFTEVDRDLYSLCKPLDGCGYLYLVDNPFNLIIYLNDFISEDHLESVIPIKSINYVGDDEVLRDIDGIMLRDSNGKLISFYTEADEDLYMIKDIDKYWISIHFSELKSKLEMVDLNEYWVYYWRSW